METADGYSGRELRIEDGNQLVALSHDNDPSLPYEVNAATAVANIIEATFARTDLDWDYTPQDFLRDSLRTWASEKEEEAFDTP